MDKVRVQSGSRKEEEEEEEEGQVDVKIKAMEESQRAEEEEKAKMKSVDLTGDGSSRTKLTDSRPKLQVNIASGQGAANSLMVADLPQGHGMEAGMEPEDCEALLSLTEELERILDPKVEDDITS